VIGWEEMTYFFKNCNQSSIIRPPGVQHWCLSKSYKQLLPLHYVPTH